MASTDRNNEEMKPTAGSIAQRMLPKVVALRRELEEGQNLLRSLRHIEGTPPSHWTCREEVQLDGVGIPLSKVEEYLRKATDDLSGGSN